MHLYLCVFGLYQILLRLLKLLPDQALLCPHCSVIFLTLSSPVSHQSGRAACLSWYSTEHCFASQEEMLIG